MSGRVSHIVRHNKDTFGKLAWYSLALFVAGIGSFFLFGRGPLAGGLWYCFAASSPSLPSFSISQALFSYALSAAAITSDRNTRDIVGAAAGLIATNLVIALYVWDAFTEDARAPAPGDRAAVAVSARSAAAGPSSGAGVGLSDSSKAHSE